MNLNGIRAADLNLLVLFQALMDEKNISRAAVKMNLTQPAMSRALQRLRHLFHDDLLLRAGQKYEPTARALQIKNELDFMFPKLESLLQPQEFKPELQSGTLRIAATDFGASVILPAFLKRFHPAAPEVELVVRPWHVNTFARLDSGALDLVLGTNVGPTHLHSELLFKEELICLVRKNHPLIQDSLTLKRYLSYPHVAISLRNGKQEPIDQFLEERGAPRRIKFRTPYAVSAALLTQETDAILTLPRRLVPRLIALSKVVVIPAPKELPSIDYVQIWHPRNDKDPYLSWVRLLMRKTCASI